MHKQTLYAIDIAIGRTRTQVATVPPHTSWSMTRNRRQRVANKKKWCHCSPDCTSFIGRIQRLRHYARVNPDTILPSESDRSHVAEESDIYLSSRSDGSGDFSRHEVLADGVQDTEMVSPQPSDSNGLSASESGSSNTSDSTLPSEEDVDFSITLEEMLHALELEVGAENESTLYDIREFSY
jgi:hypothetical protein